LTVLLVVGCGGSGADGVAPRASELAAAAFEHEREVAAESESRSERVGGLADVDQAFGATLVLSPSDMTTSSGASEVSISIPRRGMSAEAVEEMASRVELVTWPEREVVGTSARYLDEGIETAEFSRIVLDPVTPLAQRWYAIRADLTEAERPPEELCPNDRTATESVVVSRFFVGTMPIIQRAFVRVEEEGGVIEVVYSERVTGVAAPLYAEVDGLADDGCVVVNQSELGSEDGALHVIMRCPRIGASSRVRLIDSDVIRSGGRAVRAPEAERTPGSVVELSLVAGDAPEGREARGEVRAFIPAFGLASLTSS
jgi:hypothetical protein